MGVCKSLLVCVSPGFLTFLLSSVRQGESSSFYPGVSFSGSVSRFKGGDRTLGDTVPRRMQRKVGWGQTPLTNAHGRAPGRLFCLVRIQRDSVNTIGAVMRWVTTLNSSFPSPAGVGGRDSGFSAPPRVLTRGPQPWRCSICPGAEAGAAAGTLQVQASFFSFLVLS